MEGAVQYLGQYAIKASLVAAAYFAPCQEVIGIVFLFWLADLVFGVLASKNRHAPRSSRRMRKSVGKLIGYMAAILLAFLIDKLVPNLWIIPHRLMAAYLCVCELISILENLAIITQAKAFVSLIKLIRGKNDENVIYDLINEKNADYSARSPFGRVATDTVTVTEQVRDTVVVLERDQSMLRALLECDSVGQVQMRRLMEYQAGNRLKPPTSRSAIMS